jgi:hypothetical protein
MMSKYRMSGMIKYVAIGCVSAAAARKLVSRRWGGAGQFGQHVFEEFFEWIAAGQVHYDSTNSHSNPCSNLE